MCDCEECAETIAELENKVQDFEARLDAMSRRQQSMLELLLGQERELGELDTQAARPILDVLNDHDERLDDVEHDANVAIANAAQSARSDGGELTKKDVAIRESRDELCRQVAYEGASAPTITASEIQEQAKPQTTLYYQTIKDAWTELAHRWEAFRVVDGEKEERRLLLASGKVDPELAHIAQESLGRDNLTKELISRKESAGGI